MLQILLKDMISNTPSPNHKSTYACIIYQTFSTKMEQNAGFKTTEKLRPADAQAVHHFLISLSLRRGGDSDSG